MTACPKCQHAEVRVLRTDGDRRRRECCDCRHRWTTVEIPERDLVQFRAALTAARRLASVVGVDDSAPSA